MSAKPPEKLVFDKIAACRRQIDTAIWLWFNDGDIVSIHTLTDAAFGILDQLYQKRNWGRPMPLDDDPKLTTPQRRNYRKKVREAGAFGKHAQYDHDRAYQYSKSFIKAYLAFAITAHARLEDVGPGGLQPMFSLWFSLHYPHLIESAPILPQGFDIHHARKLSRGEFFRHFGGDFVGRPNLDWRTGTPTGGA
jgi:hypothetical protein